MNISMNNILVDVKQKEKISYTFFFITTVTPCPLVVITTFTACPSVILETNLAKL